MRKQKNILGVLGVLGGEFSESLYLVEVVADFLPPRSPSAQRRNTFLSEVPHA